MHRGACTVQYVLTYVKLNTARFGLLTISPQENTSQHDRTHIAITTGLKWLRIHTFYMYLYVFMHYIYILYVFVCIYALCIHFICICMSSCIMHTFYMYLCTLHETEMHQLIIVMIMITCKGIRQHTQHEWSAYFN